MRKFIWRVFFCLELDLLQYTTGKKIKADRALWVFSGDVYKDAGRWIRPTDSARDEFMKASR